MSIKLEFGKYKNETIEEIWGKDQLYCKWLYNLPFTSDEIKEYLDIKFENTNLDEYIMKFGKYKGKSITWIKEHDKKYIEWLSNNDFVKTKCPKLLNELQVN